MQYAITVCRFNDDEQEMLVDQYITADQAIDAMVLVQGFDPIEEEEVVEEEEAEAEDEAKEESAPVREKTSKGRRAGYDKAGLEADLRTGNFSSKELQAKYGVSGPTVSRVKSMLREPEGMQEAEEPGVTPYMQRRAILETKAESEPTEEEEIRQAFRNGFSVAEVSPMHPKVPMAELARLKDEALG